MLKRTMWRCFAANAISLSIIPVISGAAFADNGKAVAIHVELPKDDEGRRLTDFDHRFGIGVGDKLIVEWHEYTGSRYIHNEDCRLEIAVSNGGNVYINGTRYKSHDNTTGVSIAETDWENDEAVQWQFTRKEGCNPEDVTSDRSYFHIQHDLDYTSGLTSPLVISRIEVDGGANRRTHNKFYMAPMSNHGKNNPYSSTDACADNSPQYIHDDGEDSDFSLDAINLTLYADDGESEGINGVYIVPNRDTDRGVLTFCDSGYDPRISHGFGGWAVDYSPVEPINFDALPEYDTSAVSDESPNYIGMGLRGIDGVDLDDLAPHHNRLSIMAWNVGSIPGLPDPGIFGSGSDEEEGDGGDMFSCFLDGSHCNAKWRKRRAKLHDMSDYIDAAQPDVIIFTEAFQDKMALAHNAGDLILNYVTAFGFGIDAGGTVQHENWTKTKARAKLKDNLSHDYSFATVMPNDQPDWQSSDYANSASPSERYNPALCPTNAPVRSADISDVYSDAPVYWPDHCTSPQGVALDSGILIGVRSKDNNALSFSGGSGSNGDYFYRYKNSDAGEGSGAKGIRMVKITKGVQEYKIFATHFQSKRTKCTARVAQISEAVAFIDENVNSGDRAILIGDLNIDPWRNNHSSADYHEMNAIGESGKECRNELEYLTQKLRTVLGGGTLDVDVAGRVPLGPNSLPFSNDCSLNGKVGGGPTSKCGTADAPTGKSSILDHAFWISKKPTHMGTTIVRQVSDGTSDSYYHGQDLTGHYPNITVLDYTGATDTHVDLKPLVLPNKYTFPMMCPYGFPVLVDGDQYSDVSSVSTIDGSQDLACLPADCGTDRSTDRCNPLKIAGLAADRKYCLSGEEHWAAPCIVQPGYENLVGYASSVEASTTLGTSWGPELVRDGKVTSSGSNSYIGNRAWAADSASTGNDWVKISWQKANYVKRIRFRNGAAGGARWRGAKTYSLIYNDTSNVGSCTNAASFSYAVDPNIACPKYFGTTQSVDVETTTYSDSSLTFPDPDAWHVHELDTPVLTDEILFYCDDKYWNGCGVAELEVYGGAE